jgi:hypothetical protein
MTGLTDFITQAQWADILLVWLVVVDDAYQALEARFGPWRRRGPRPTFHDSEVITVGLFIDTVFHGHEALGLAFLRQYHSDLFPALLPEGQFNQRRRELGLVIEQIRQHLISAWGLIRPPDRYRLIDSAPIPVCTYMRASRNQTVAGPEYFSVMKSRGAKLFGVRLHLTVTTDQVVDHWLLAPAAPRDSKVMTAVFDGATDLIGFGDNAFHDPIEQDHLLNHQNIRLYAALRKDALAPWPEVFRLLASRLRRRIETTFSVLTTVFNIERPGSRSLSGLIARVATRILAYTLCFITGPLLAQLKP